MKPFRKPPTPGDRPETAPGLKRILLCGIVRSILVIEILLMLGSLAYRCWWEGVQGWPLLWYALRLVALVALILFFVVLVLQRFLARQVLEPLQAIIQANRRLRAGDDKAARLEPDPAWPREIQEIARTRQGMLETITRVSQERLRLVEFIRRTFGRYLPPEVVDQILDSPQGRRLGGQRKRVSVMMSDLRGFTRLSEDRDPEEMVALLNRYLGVMSQVIEAHGGLIDDIIGDGVMTVFGAVTPRDDDPLRAVACAITMQNRLRELNREVTAQGWAPLQMGIGIASGEVVVGNIGSASRMKYGMVGATVNRASRIESDTVGGQVFIDQETRRALGELVTCAPPRRVNLKGIPEPITVYPVLALGPPYDLELLQEEEGEAIPFSLEFTCWPVIEKHLSPQPLKGRTLSLDNLYLDAWIEKELEPPCEVKLKLHTPLAGHQFAEIYAKVVELAPRGRPPRHRLRITSIGAADWLALRRWPRREGGQSLSAAEG